MQATCFILLTVAVGLSASNNNLSSVPLTVNQNLDVISGWLANEIDTLQLLLNNTEPTLKLAFHDIADRVIEEITSQLLLQCNSSQILTDLQVLKGRQAVAGAIAVAQVCMFVTYILFCLGIYLVKRCKKHQEKEKRQEFALLEKQLTESRRKRRAAAAAMNKQNPQ